MPSFDIARGRDFGEPSYNKFRQLCGLSEAKTFQDFTDQISKKVNTSTNFSSHNNCTPNYYSWNPPIITIQLIIKKKKKIFFKNVDTLASLYEDPNDVDFYVGGMLEKLKPGSSLGHTFQCISGEMFYRWKFGDRFFYEFGNQTGSFRPGNECHFH